ncbi:MAG: 3-deoxy-7-phosphoheptulonate synthase class II [Acidimicrobiia bacterium]|nr:3-deoxy-7-phosphoheptulonate synthase class II [Acidimicrobiia bacterium]
MSEWTPSSWRSKAIQQQPSWPDEGALEDVLKRLSALPPLVFAGEARELQAQLAEAAAGRAFLLQAGDCAESFNDFNADKIRDKLKIILQMAVVLTYSSGVPVVKIGRIAGQFAKPRSSDTETRDGTELPSFRGHMVNDDDFTTVSRAPNPERLINAYHQSASTLNLLRAFAKGGFADLSQVHAWNQQFVTDSPQGQRYEEIADGIDRALRFMEAAGVISETHPQLHEVDFYTSHEGLLLGYEESLTRKDSLTGDWYDCSAHMVWIGERTRNLDGAHIEFFRGILNPIGCKIGPTATPQEVVDLCRTLNPDNIPGRLTLIVRMGAGNVRELLPPILRAVDEAGCSVLWTSDPMHGNTFTSESGKKTRHFDDVLDEVAGFFEAHAEVGTWPGGIHCELTGEDVTECLGGSEELLDHELHARYETVCDPRLNARQSLDMAFRVAELLQNNRPESS